MVTRCVRGVTVRYMLGIAILLCAAGAILQGINLLLEQPLPQLQTASVAVTFGSLGLMVIIVILLFFLASRYRCGKSVPEWAKSLCNKEN